MQSMNGIMDVFSMQKLIRIFCAAVVTIIFFFTTIPTHAQTTPQDSKPKEEVSKAKVLRILEEGQKDIGGQKQLYQKVEVQFLDGPEKDKKLTIMHGDMITIREEQKVKQDQKVVILKTSSPQTTLYQIVDSYRLDNLIPIIVFFLLLVITISRWKGLGSLIGLAISLLVIVNFIVPNILAGDDPLTTTIVGSLFIMVTTIYISHGFNQKTHIALMATCISLVLTGILAFIFVHVTSLTGLGSEDATSLRYGPTGNINFQGLLLGGIIIGTLGVLDDITTGLASAMQELAKTNHKLQFKQLFASGLRIGSDHIASLVNTLALAYAGAGLPLFLFIVLNPSNQPLWFILNSEMLVEEIIRTLAGSIGLIMAVPLTALLAAWAFQKKT